MENPAGLVAYSRASQLWRAALGASVLGCQTWGSWAGPQGLRALLTIKQFVLRLWKCKHLAFFENLGPRDLQSHSPLILFDFYGTVGLCDEFHFWCFSLVNIKKKLLILMSTFLVLLPICVWYSVTEYETKGSLPFSKQLCQVSALSEPELRVLSPSHSPSVWTVLIWVNLLLSWLYIPCFSDVCPSSRAPAQTLFLKGRYDCKSCTGRQVLSSGTVVTSP